ncbi:uncharacterized protein LOC131614217 [Vicia villosa]|uniref:uncharacterized protein LOC131614217 n=1 Tax=Vicia villosa TaxID=3911 RepID=UPI00273C766E|nr:uncharacterized protein LOC131614217 [Vicia villosa]
MVAKQGWNMLAKPHSLVSRVFKARYFPRTSFLKSSLGYNPSFVWRSLWKSREVLTLGCRWSIGDGSNIMVMNEPWLQGQWEGNVIGPPTQGVYNIFVNNLMLPNMKQWDVQVIQNLFDPVVAMDIFKVPLVEEVVKDTIIWKEEQNGIYSVRSGYRLWRISQANRWSKRVDRNWSNLWNIIAPPRAKHLLWRICRGCLTSRSRLIQHFVQCPAHCLREDRRDVGRFAVLVDEIWKNRNNIVWNDTREEARKIGLQAYFNWHDWFLARRNEERVQEPPSPTVWTPPDEGKFKCNADAGYNNSLGTANKGWCVRKNGGHFIVAGVTWDYSMLPTNVAEAMALKEAMQDAISLQLNNVIFESDSQLVVQVILSNQIGRSEFSHVILAIKNLLHFFLTLRSSSSNAKRIWLPIS